MISTEASRKNIIFVFCVKQTDGMQHDEIHLLALHTYDSSNPEDLTFHQGDTITLLSRGDVVPSLTYIHTLLKNNVILMYSDWFSLVNQDWLEGQCHGNTGIFPASFVEEVPINGK